MNCARSGKLGTAVKADGVAPTLQAALDDWSRTAPRLNALSDELNAGRAAGAFALDFAALADEAERAGLVSRILPASELLEDAIRTADTIASMSLPAAMMVKEAVNRADQLSLAEGLRHERRVFHAMFALDDQKEGMAAFVEKRPAEFKHR